jgi:hypothetical protein
MTAPAPTPEQLDDVALLARIRQSSDGRIWHRLFDAGDGRTEQPAYDDLTVASILLRHTADDAQCIRFLQHWARHWTPATRTLRQQYGDPTFTDDGQLTGGHTPTGVAGYLGQLVANARHLPADRAETSSGNDQPVRRSLADYLEHPLQAPPTRIARLAWAGMTTLLSAADGWGKSTILKAGCAAYTQGAEFLGERGGPAGDVLWGRFEESEYELYSQMVRFGADKTRFMGWTPGSNPTAELVAEIRGHPWGVVVMDSAHEFCILAGVDKLDDAVQVSKVLHPIVVACQETGTALVWLGQANKATGSYRNSTYFGHAPSVRYEMAEPKEGSNERVFKRKKQRAIELPKQFCVALVGDAFRLVQGGTTAEPSKLRGERKKVLAALKSGMRHSEWAAAYKGSLNTFNYEVRELQKLEMVTQAEESGTWSPVQFTVEQELRAA